MSSDVSMLTRWGACAALALCLPLSSAAQHTSKPASAPHVAAPAAHAAAPAAHAAAGAHPGATTGAHPGATTGAHPGSVAGAHPGAGAGHPGGTVPNRTVGTTHMPNGGTRTVTRNGGEINRGPNGHVASYRGPNGHEAHFGANGHVREVHGDFHGNHMVVAHGPGGMRRVVVEHPDHARFVAYGHGRGYIQRPYAYGGHSYYARAYYYHGGYYRNYYRGYYYHGYYLNSYMPAYYYPPAYYSWAYRPWPTPYPYAWGWHAYPWYGYYGAYFQPYPVYPSPAYWIADYMIAASLADAYAAAAAANANLEQPLPQPRLIYASYDPSTGTTSPTMTKEVKDAVSKEIESDLAAQTAGEDKSPASFTNLLADGKPHVFIASTGLTVPAGNEECGLTEGDVIALSGPPAASAENVGLRVLASKKGDCQLGADVAVPVEDLQEMHNHLLENIDKGMLEMKDHPGQGGMPAPPADATAGIKAAPYADAAPAADPNGGAALDADAQQGDQMEKEVVAEANGAEAQPGETPASPIGATTPAAPPMRAGAPITISLGQTPAQVMAAKGPPSNKVQYPNSTKQMYIYPDMKIIFVGGKVSDVQ